MFSRLGHLVARRAGWALLLSLLFVLATAAVGSRVIPQMSSGGYDDPQSESSRATAYLTSHFHQQDPWAVLVLACPASVDTPACTQAAARVQQRVATVTGVQRVTSYWTLGHPAPMRSTDGRAAYLFVYGQGSNIEQLNAMEARVERAATPAAAQAGVRVYFSGSGALYNGINGRVKHDIAKAEGIAVPLSLVLTLIVFGSLVAALTPLTVALFAIPAGLFVLWLVHRFTDVSVFGLNIITGLGLGLGIDYALLIVNRFREEQAREANIETAVVRTVETAGRTVFFSGITVALTLGALGLFPLYFLQTFAWAGVSTVLFAVIGALVPMPAMLALIGHRIDRWKVRSVRPASDDGAWARVSGFVMQRPVRIVIGTLILLGILAAPALHLQTGQPDERVLPASDPVAAAGQFIRTHFDGRETQPVEIVIPGGVAASAAVDAYATRVSQLPHVVRVVTPSSVLVHGAVVAPNPAGAGAVAGPDVKVEAIGDVDARSPAGQALIESIRALPRPTPGTLIGGSAAIYTDSQHGVLDHVPAALLWIAIMTMVVLFLFTGSVLLPIKAVLLNVLSLGATFGVITWVFQDGHLRELLGGFTVRGDVDTSQLVLIVILVFGLSMDYELFLLSRIKELHDAGADTETAVQLGLQRSGRIITAAALILAAVFAAFITSAVTSMKLIGFGVGFAILLDASVVRALLVPALMRIAGRWDWWAPRPLRALHERLHLAH